MADCTRHTEHRRDRATGRVIGYDPRVNEWGPCTVREEEMMDADAGQDELRAALADALWEIDKGTPGGLSATAYSTIADALLPVITALRGVDARAELREDRF